MTDPRSPRVLVIDLKITEYDDGKIVNEAKLRQEGSGEYVAVAHRVIAALAGEDDGSDSGTCDWVMAGVGDEILDCRLRAGHAGQHHASNGADWTPRSSST